jgi:dephospho-CoA kinase
MKLLIVGNGRHGKDTLAEILHEKYGLKFKGSSEAAKDCIVFPILRSKYGYTSSEECYEDRHNHRSEWFSLITEYNSLDKARLARVICKDYDIYIGMRNDLEFRQCLTEKLFDHVIWVDASERLPPEDSSSFNIPFDPKLMHVIHNNGTRSEFQSNVEDFIRNGMFF